MRDPERDMSRPYDVLQQQAHVADVAQPLFRISLQAAHEQRTHLSGQARQIRLIANHLSENFSHIFALEQMLAREQFVQHNAKGPDVGTLIDRLFPARLLRRHVGGGAKNHAGLRHAYREGG
jgi:hypothetical protein